MVLYCLHMAINVEVVRKTNENNVSVLRRFSRRVQESGVVIAVKGRRYAERTASKYTRKKSKLKLLDKKEKIQELIKLGKMVDGRRGR